MMTPMMTGTFFVSAGFVIAVAFVAAAAAAAAAAVVVVAAVVAAAVTRVSHKLPV